MIKKLEEVREALKEIQRQYRPITSPNNREPAFVLSSKALATLDRILGQDEAEMVERVVDALNGQKNQTQGNKAKAALRALGLMKEGE